MGRAVTFDFERARRYIERQLAAGALTADDVALLAARYQAAQGLVVDGMPGPATLARLRAASAAPPPRAAAPTTPLERAGVAVIEEAHRLWLLDVIDPRVNDRSSNAIRCRGIIDEIVRSDRGAGWSWLPAYAGDGAVEWCGMFAAWCWADWLTLPTRKTFWPSTYRLDAWAAYRPVGDARNTRPPSGPYRVRVELDERSTDLGGVVPQPGDVLLVGDGSPAYGDHVTLVERYDSATRTFHTYEGNGGGRGPGGNRQHGVVRAERPLGARAGHSYIARRLIRPAPADVVADA